MAEDWTLQVISHQAIESWEVAARRLRALLDAVSTKVEEVSELHLAWRDEDLDVDAWFDTKRIAEEMVRLRTKNDDGSVVDSLGARGVVQGYLDAAHARGPFVPGTWDVNVRWSFRKERAPANCLIEFSGASGRMGSLDTYSSEWLASLTCAAVAAIDADSARVFTGSLLRALHEAKAEPSFSLGAVSYAPYGLAGAALPDSLNVFGCPARSVTGKVIVVDLRRAVSEPGSTIDDLLKIEPVILTTEQIRP